MKKISVLLSVLLCVCILFTACAGSTNYKNTKVSGYDKPFIQYFEKYLKKLLSGYVSSEGDKPLPSYEIKIKDSWEGDAAPDASALTGDQTPVTIMATLDLKGNVELKQELRRLVFYFIYSSKLDQFTLKYAVAYGENDYQKYSESDSAYFIEQIYSVDRIINLGK